MKVFFNFSVSDMPKEDILQYFDETNKFIDSALEANKRVMVHW